MADTDTRPGAPSPIPTGLLGRCPRCGKGSLFSGFLTLAPRCASCGLDTRFADTGDGPSFFASFLGGFLTLLVGVYAQIVYSPAWWVYALVLALGVAATILMIRPLKGVLVALQYANSAEQGRFEPTRPDP